MAIPEPLLGQIQAVQFTDAEIRRIATNSALESARILADMSPTSVRAIQIKLANEHTQMWANMHSATKVGIGDGVWNATSAQALFDEGMFAGAGLPSTYWRDAMFAQAGEGINALISRKENGITLSQRVYRTSVGSTGKLQQTINTGLALGKSVAEIKKDVIGYVNPATPGGSSYAAQRLARSEVLNAYHTTAINNYKKTPWINRVRWNLSGSHTRPDQCNDYADEEFFGVNDVPDKPHPNCLCYLTPEVIPFDQFKKNFDAGKYDSHLSDVMGCYKGA
jgi:hypothetical protein